MFGLRKKGKESDLNSLPISGWIDNDTGIETAANVLQTIDTCPEVIQSNLYENFMDDFDVYNRDRENRNFYGYKLKVGDIPLYQSGLRQLYINRGSYFETQYAKYPSISDEDEAQRKIIYEQLFYFMREFDNLGCTFQFKNEPTTLEKIINHAGICDILYKIRIGNHPSIDGSNADYTKDYYF